LSENGQQRVAHLLIGNIALILLYATGNGKED
jgi:hypothetical protein